VYSIFFAGYLTGLALGGVVAAIIAGNVSVAALFAARRALRPATLDRACLVMIAACRTVMTVAHQGHGIGIVADIAIASLALARTARIAVSRCCPVPRAVRRRDCRKRRMSCVSGRRNVTSRSIHFMLAPMFSSEN
jgi:hypothetical protein